MYRLLAMAFLLTAIGCVEKPTSPPTAQQISDESSTTADIPSVVPVPQNDDSLEYPEKDDVVRLLVRASELESKGEFQDALVVTNRAITIDPSSLKANEMKARLEELLRRIQMTPQLDERKESYKVAQRTKP